MENDREPGAKPEAAEVPQNDLLGLFAKHVATWQGTVAVLAAFVSTTATAAAVVFKNWLTLTLTVVLVAFVVAIYIASLRKPMSGISPRAVQWTALAALVFGPIAIVLVVSFGAIFTHHQEIASHRTSIAIAQFDGPDLPKPYEKCRPSDMLTDKLATVEEQFHRLNAFELPYVVANDGRWAKNLAQLHLQLEGADTLVYGEYSTYRSPDAKVGDSSTADKILVSPQTESSQIPDIPLLWKSSGLTKWSFPDQHMSIAELCSGDGGHVAFLADAQRIAYALAGLQLAYERHFEEARSALESAQSRDGSPSMAGDVHGSCASARFGASPQHRAQKAGPTFDCSGVLSFYLAVLQQRFGLYEAADANYRTAAAQLREAAPFIDLARLEIRIGDHVNALRSFRRAVATEPDSIEALAALSEFRWEYHDVREADIYLDRAFRLIASAERPFATQKYSVEDAIAVARALVQRAVKPRIANGATTGEQDPAMYACAMKELDATATTGRLLESADPESATDFSRWIFLASDSKPAAAREALRKRALAILQRVLERDPFDPRANEQFALDLKAIAGDGEGGALLARYPLGAEYYYEHAYAATALEFAKNDQDFIEHANVAHALGRDEIAGKAYDAAIGINPNSFDAHFNLGNLYADSKNERAAIGEFETARALRPFDVDVADRLKKLVGETGFVKLAVTKSAGWNELLPVDTRMSAEYLKMDPNTCRFSGLATDGRLVSKLAD